MARAAGDDRLKGFSVFSWHARAEASLYTPGREVEDLRYGTHGHDPPLCD